MNPVAWVLLLGRGHLSHILKMHYFLKNSFALLPGIDQANYVYSNDDQGQVYKNVNFMTPAVVVQMLGRGHESRYSE